MKSIAKKTEPLSLTQHRANHADDYVPTYKNLSLQALDDLRKSLVNEQGAICCYCMGRIKPDGSAMKIEHWEARTNNPSRQLDYSNLLGACLGGEKYGKKTDPRTHHCDTKKGDDDFIFNPAEPHSNMESRLRYLHDGTIESDDARLDEDINLVLNLNCSLLRENRLGVLKALKNSLGKRSLRRAEWQKLLAQWETPPFEPYCQIVIFYIKKQLRRHDL